MNSFNGQDGMRVYTFDGRPEEDTKTYPSEGIKAQPPKIQKLKKDKDGYHPVRTDNEWRGMYQGLYEDWRSDTSDLRKSNIKKELKIIDLEIESLKLTVIFSEELIKEKEKYRMAVVQMREDWDSVADYQDKDYESREQSGYKYCVEKGECKIVDKED